MADYTFPNIDDAGNFTSPEVLARLDERYTGGGTGGATTLDDLNDVDLTTDPALEGEVLVKRGTHWVPETINPTPQLGLDDLTDVDTVTTAPTSGQTLVWDGVKWAPGTVEGGTGTGGDASVLVINQGATVPEGTAEGTIIFERTS